MTATDDRHDRTVTPELVVLLDEDGRAVGTADKAGVHHADTPLHLAFSCYVFDDAGNVLRHPAGAAQAHVPRRVDQQLLRPPGARRAARGRRTPPGRAGARHRPSTDLRLVLPRFRYRAEQDGVVENEMCPVFVGSAAGTVRADPDEVERRPVGAVGGVPRRRPRRQPRRCRCGAASRSPSCPPTRCPRRPRTSRTSRPPRRSSPAGPEVASFGGAAPARVTP